MKIGRDNFFSGSRACQVDVDEILRVECIVRNRYNLKKEDLVFILQVAHLELGFPPDATLVVFFKDSIRFRWRSFEPVANFVENHLPPYYLLPSLQDLGDGDCC